ncbi:centriole and centriolar satellite protein OFD1 [Ochlerotatus camptorhynchus]|uniref:centriole and centriolar satellite protein OFD1 n=1 Tax=Ochlerotatus camptorhynchus TaxID=644619 RepID=UPI0031E36B0C
MNDAQDFLDPDNITHSEFRAEIKNWIEEQGIHTNLQLQMKKDLIDQISRTAMGRKISLKMQTHQGIVLSPLVLVLNTLVAEFLYTQNCHFSLSVFSSEVPFKNTLPDFTKSKHFRLSRIELKEIFEALGVDHYSGLVEKYEAKTTKEGGKSLLYIIFKSMLASVRTYEDKFKRLKNEEAERETTKTMLDGLAMDKLHKNIEKLLQRMKLVEKSIGRVEELHREDGHRGKEEETNSLKVCTESVSRMVSRLEVYSKTLEDLIVKLQIQAQTDNAVEEEKVPEQAKPVQVEQKSYTDFLNELKTTEPGRKYVAKLQKQVLKLMDKEKALIEAKYEKKLHEAELEYKSKLEGVLSERIREMSVPREIQRSPKLTKRESESEESVHFMKKIDEKLNQLYQHERNVDEKLVTLKNDLQKHEMKQSKYFQSLKTAETKEKKLLVLQDVERQLLATFEDETQAIIQNAKTTIEHLESESDKINRSFQQYLQKQREDKRRLNDEKVQIWQKYNDEKLELNQRELMGINGHRSQAVVTMKQTYQPHHEEIPEMGDFENPFKNFDPHKYLRQPKVCNIVLDSPREHNVVDVAVNTTVEPASLKPSLTEARKSVSPNVHLLESARLDRETSKPVDQEIDPKPSTVESTASHNLNVNLLEKEQADSKLSELLAKDTLNLKRSIEENLQKLDQMSKTYTKSTSSSEQERQRTYNVKPTEKSLDDLSSGAELGISDGESSVGSLGKRGDRVDLNSTKELLEYARKNFSIGETNEGLEAKKDSPELGSLGSLSDLDVSGDSKSNAGKGVELEDSVHDILEDISTGKRSLSDNSWN